MTNKFTFDDTFATRVSDEQKVIDKNKDQSGALKEDTNERKVTQYANFMASVHGAPRQKGNLSPVARRAVEAGYAAVNLDINKGVGQRLANASVALTNPRIYKKVFGDTLPGDNATPEFFEARLVEAGLTTEGKIQAAAKDDDKDPLDDIVRKLVGGFTYAKDDNGERVENSWRAGKLVDRLDEFKDKLADAERMALAFEAAVQEQGKENVDIRKIADTLRDA